MSEPEFLQIQQRFSAYLRDPEAAPAPPVEERRLKIYRELIFNNVDGFLRQAFPVLVTLLPATRWQKLVRQFLIRHSCQSPYFRDVSREFVSFLASEAYQPDNDPHFVPELAHYEWMELVLDTSDEQVPATGFNPEGDLLAGAPMLTPLMCLLSYHYPVHKISVEFQPETPSQQPVWLLVYRDRSEQVRFMEVNAVTARLLTLMQAAPLSSGRVLLAGMAEELGLPGDSVLHHGADVLRGLRERGVLLGTRLDDIDRIAPA